MELRSESYPITVTAGQQFDYCVGLCPQVGDLRAGSVISIFVTDRNTGYLYAEKNYVTERTYEVGEVLPKICVTMTAPLEAKEWNLKFTGRLAQKGVQEFEIFWSVETVDVFPIFTATPMPTTSSTTTPGAPPETPQGPLPGGPPTEQPPPGQPPFPSTEPTTTGPKPEIIPSQVSDNFMLILALVIIALLAVVAGYLFGKRKSKGVVACSKCGHTSELGTKFCPECGTKL